MITTVVSKNGVPIRLTDERWTHITEEHCELAGLRLEVLETVANPERIVAGGAGESLAIRPLGVDKWFVAVYREMAEDGFIITAFLTSKIHALDKRRQLWP
ncbi:MAG: hypothetical protein HY580_07300 [Nitrospinae bacterium]|nr:hypothetical protein [Nitrospinota bacterium]